MCVCACAFVCACMCMCLYVCVCVCVCMCPGFDASRLQPLQEYLVDEPRRFITKNFRSLTLATGVCECAASVKEKNRAPKRCTRVCALRSLRFEYVCTTHARTRTRTHTHTHTHTRTHMTYTRTAEKAARDMYRPFDVFDMLDGPKRHLDKTLAAGTRGAKEAAERAAGDAGGEEEAEGPEEIVYHLRARPTALYERVQHLQSG